jgi:hypothetical protein
MGKVAPLLRPYGGGVSAFADVEGEIQWGFGFGVTKLADTDWFCQPVEGYGICQCEFYNHDVTPPFQREKLAVHISNVEVDGLTWKEVDGLTWKLTATLTRLDAPLLPGGDVTKLDSFLIKLNLLCMG